METIKYCILYDLNLKIFTIWMILIIGLVFKSTLDQNLKLGFCSIVFCYLGFIWQKNEYDRH